ncbi:hypothetical protein NC651_017540 [Populus alba x Populus x berolinensis]|nr:hypothetical protein NC651_017540 [Populus alba x Populus x berolinensis]
MVRKVKEGRKSSLRFFLEHFTPRLDFEYGEAESRDPPLALDALRC